MRLALDGRDRINATLARIRHLLGLSSFGLASLRVVLESVADARHRVSRVEVVDVAALLHGGIWLRAEGETDIGKKKCTSCQSMPADARVCAALALPACACRRTEHALYGAEEVVARDHLAELVDA